VRGVLKSDVWSLDVSKVLSICDVSMVTLALVWASVHTATKERTTTSVLSDEERTLCMLCVVGSGRQRNERRKRKGRTTTKHDNEGKRIKLISDEI